MTSLKDLATKRGRFKYKTPIEFAEACDSYFDLCAEAGKPATMAGLTLHLGYGRKDALYRLKERDGIYGELVDMARLKIEAGYEERLVSGIAMQGVSFALKQMGWSDKKEIDVKDDRKIADMSEEVRTSKLKGLIDLVKRRQPNGVDVHVPELEDNSWMGDMDDDDTSTWDMD